MKSPTEQPASHRIITAVDLVCLSAGVMITRAHTHTHKQLIRGFSQLYWALTPQQKKQDAKSLSIFLLHIFLEYTLYCILSTTNVMKSIWFPLLHHFSLHFRDFIWPLLVPKVCGVILPTITYPKEIKNKPTTIRLIWMVLTPMDG